MARTIRNAKLDTRSARSKLPERKAAYWLALAQGCAIGYRKGRKGGVWIAKIVRPGYRRETTLGPADDAFDADGVTALSYAQVQEQARDWFSKQARATLGEPEAASGPYTVAQALADYERDYIRRGGKALNRFQAAAAAHILPGLGEVEVHRLTRRRLENWLDGLAEAPARLRTRPGHKQRHRQRDNSGEGQRRRKATANRVLTVLKGALNLALRNRHVASGEPWQTVKPYREANAPKIRYLSDDESQRFVNPCPPDFRALVTAALLSGCRYGELSAMTAGDYSRYAGAVHVPVTKSGKARHVYLTDEGRAFFDRAAAGKSAGELLFPRADGKPWGQAHQFRPMRDACRAARIKPAISFHILRHTYASRLAMRGVPMAVIAEQLGHADTRMTERHYAHLSPSYVADAIRAGFPALGIVETSNVGAIRLTAR